jgi:predicted transcriptional regulator
MADKTLVHAAIDGELAEVLRAEAERQERSISWLIREAIRFYLLHQGALS